MRFSRNIALTSGFCISALSVFVVWCGGCSTKDASSGNSAAGSGASSASGETTSSGLPYQPAACDYQVAAPEVSESGLDDGKVGAGKPDHVHASFAGKSDTTFAINWRTGNDTTASELLFGSDKAAGAAADGAIDKVKLVKGHHLLYGSTLDANQTRVHEAHVCGLMPATNYSYKVGGPGSWSEVFTISTAPAAGSGATWRFAVLGDSRDDPTTFAKIEEAIAAQTPALQVFTGDAVATGVLQTTWNKWFEATTGKFAVQTMMAQAPLMPVNGNHENLAINYAAQFALPQQVSAGEKAQGEEWYSFDYANAHFVALNDSPPAAAVSAGQVDWLKADLAAVDRKKTPWVFAMHHRSLYSCGGSHGSDLELRAAWQPIFDQNKVDVVFSGHDHLYERSKPMRGLNGTAGVVAQAGTNDTPVMGSGTLYLLTGGAGAPLYDAAKKLCDHTHVTESTRNYAIVDITGSKIRVKSLRLDGSTLDDFEFTK